MRILLSGSRGLIGRHVGARLRRRGDAVVPLIHGEPPGVGPTGEAIWWNTEGTLDPGSVGGFDAVVHLAGEPVAEGRWTKAKKQRIRESRVQGTRRLVAALQASGRPPGVFVCASGINVYGDGGDRVLDESCPAGDGFLAEVCVGWEAAAQKLAEAARVVSLRIGVVLTPEGGALAAMLPLFRTGLAGPIAGGRQWISWVSLEDMVRAVEFALGNDGLRGPVNVTSPQPVRGREFTAALAAATGRPAVVPVPALAARLLLGEVAEETVLASVRAVPGRLGEAGFIFQQPVLTNALAEWGLRG